MTLNLSLVISGDASGAKKAASETKGAITEVGAAAKQSSTAAASAVQSTIASTAGAAQVAASSGAAAAQAAVAGVGSTAKLSAQQIQNLQFQLQDVVVGLSSGQGFGRVMLQQGSQIVQAFGPGQGVLGALKAVGAGVVSFVTNPLNLALLGFTAAGVAAQLLFSAIGSGGQDANAVLEKHEDLIKRVKEAYGDAANSARAYGVESKQVLQFESEQDVAALRAKLLDEIKGQLLIFKQMEGNKLSLIPDPNVTPPEIRPFQAALKGLDAELQGGVPNLAKFQSLLVTIGRSDEANSELRKVADELLKIFQNADQAHRALEAMGGAAFGGDSNVLLRLQAGASDRQSMKDELAFALQQKAQIERIRQGFDGDLIAIGARSPADREAAAALKERISLTGQALTAEEAELRIAQAGAIARARAEFELSEALRHRVSAYDEAVASAQLDLDVIGKSAGEVARLRFEHQQLAAVRRAAADAGVAVDEREIALIQQKAAEIGKLIQLQATASLRNDIGFERSQIFRSGADQDIASRLRGIYGDDLAAHMQDFEARQLRINEGLRTAGDLAHEFGNSLLRDLQNGVKPIDAVTNAFGRLAERLEGMALDAAINKLLSMLTSAFGSGFGGVLPGGAPLGHGGIGHFDTGGWTGSGPHHQVAGVVHREEYVVNAAATRRYRPLLEAINGGGSPRGFMAGGYAGPVAWRTSAGSSDAAPVHFAPTTHINVAGNADSSTVAALDAELDRRDQRWREQLPDLIRRARQDRLL